MLREVRSGPVTVEAPPRTAPVPRCTGSAELGQVLRDRPVNLESDEPKASRTNIAASPWFARAGWAIALLLLAVGLVFWWPEQPLEGAAGVLQSLAKAVSYTHLVNDDQSAAAYLKQSSDVIGLVIDAELAESPLEVWLTRLRTQLAWAGLPALFVTRPPQMELKNLLAKFDAPNVELDDAQPHLLQEALTQLLQGKH